MQTQRPHSAVKPRSTAEKLRSYREALGVSRAALGRYLHKTHGPAYDDAYLALLERGRIVPNASETQRVLWAIRRLAVGWRRLRSDRRDRSIVGEIHDIAEIAHEERRASEAPTAEPDESDE